MDFIQHGVRPQQYIVVPETQHAVVVDAELASALVVICELIQMLSSIELDHQPLLGTGEIHDVSGNWILPTKLVTRHLAAFQELP